MNRRAPLLALHALTCVTAFLLCLAGTASGKAALSPEKTASGDFFADPGESTWQTAPQPLQAQWETGPSPTQTASGRQVWLSADPLGEAGGINLYGYVGGNPLNGTDPLGLVDLNISPRNEPRAVEAMDRWNPKGTGFTVGGHGSSSGDGMTDSQGVPLTPERLAELIQTSGKYKKGQTVTLYMCNTGGACATGDNFAQRLANILEAGVRAPNGIVVLSYIKSEKKPSKHWLSSIPGGKPDPNLKYIWHSAK
ncbi:MAG: RHS repeat-associated core domain-containing protein [Akkermansiaceae bacterium]|nr:RHS repeat-associated core domain-containing protein [Luteolibacter sp.]